MFPLVSVVVLNYNGVQHLQSCLDSLIDLDYPEIEIIVVDNGSTDGSLEFLRSSYPSVKVIELGRNMGSCIGYMSGVLEGKGKFVAILSNDMEVDRNWLKPLVSVLENMPNVAAADSKYKSYFHRDRFEDAAAAGRWIDYFGNNYTRGVNEIDAGQYNKRCYIIGVVTIFRKDLLTKIGGFDKSYFYGYEDIDIGWRIYMCGYKAIYVPESVIYHKSGATSRIGKDRKIRPELFYYIKRNRLISLIKNYELQNILLGLSVSTLEYTLTLFYFAVTNQTAQFRALFRAMLFILPNLREIMKGRTSVQRLRLLSDRQVKQSMLRYCGDIAGILGGRYDPHSHARPITG
jgi:GT2 family glycosyltransferase